MDEQEDISEWLNNDEEDVYEFFDSASGEEVNKKKQDAICLDHLNGPCTKRYCQYHHFLSKFVWQSRANYFDPWVNLTENLSKIVEETFCSVTTDGAVINSLWVDFDNKDESGNFLTEGSATSTIYRRLSTPSSALSTNTGATKWMWYLESSPLVWEECSRRADIEQAYCSGQSYFQFRDGSNSYCILFDEMIQINIDNPDSVQLKVRRRPLNKTHEIQSDFIKKITQEYLEEPAGASQLDVSNFPYLVNSRDVNQQPGPSQLNASGSSDISDNSSGRNQETSLSQSNASNTPTYVNDENPTSSRVSATDVSGSSIDRNQQAGPSHSIANDNLQSNGNIAIEMSDDTNSDSVLNNQTAENKEFGDNQLNNETTSHLLQYNIITSTSSSGSKDSKYPQSWPNECPAGHLIDIPSKLKNNLEKEFVASLQSVPIIVVSIQEVCNHDVYDRYLLKKNQFIKKGKDPGEKFLYHGTSPRNIPMICSQNFDFRISGTNGTALGKGTYFATRANYSHLYSIRQHGNSYSLSIGETANNHRADDEFRYMFLCQVLTGRVTRGCSIYVRPPPLFPGSLELFDSCVDNERNPSTFVIFDRDQCYPRYLIKYRLFGPEPHTYQFQERKMEFHQHHSLSPAVNSFTTQSLSVANSDLQSLPLTSASNSLQNESSVSSTNNPFRGLSLLLEGDDLQNKDSSTVHMNRLSARRKQENSTASQVVPSSRKRANDVVKNNSEIKTVSDPFKVNSRIKDTKMNELNAEDAEMNEFQMSRSEMNGTEMNKSETIESKIDESPINESPMNESPMNESIAIEHEMNETEIQESKMNDSKKSEAKITETDMNESEMNELEIIGSKPNDFDTIDVEEK